VLGLAKADVEKESLRQQSVAGMMDAMYKGDLGGYYRALTHQARHPEIKHNLAMALEGFKKVKTPEDLANTIADTKRTKAATGLDKKQIEEFVETTLGDQAGEMRLRDLVSALPGGGDRGPGLAEEKFSWQLTEDARNAEEEVLKYPKDKSSIPHIRTFNQQAEVPYVYIWIEPGTFWGGGAKKVDLPPVGGQRITARDVYFTARKMGMTVEEYIRRIPGIEIPGE